MIDEQTAFSFLEKSKALKYSSMEYIDAEELEVADTLCNTDSLILLRDASKAPAMLHFAADDFSALVNIIAGIPGELRLHFVPREYAGELKALGFTEWGEYTDFWNPDLASTAAALDETGEPEYLTESEYAEVSAVSQECRLQSRGFEGETPEWFAQWLLENDVIVWRKQGQIAGYCCVSIYSGGQNLWIRELAVAPGHQRLGIGKALMRQAVRYGVEHGAVKGFLAADILNKNAIGLYNKYGFFQKARTASCKWSGCEPMKGIKR